MNTLCTYYKIKIVVLAKVRLSYIRELAASIGRHYNLKLTSNKQTKFGKDIRTRQKETIMGLLK